MNDIALLLVSTALNQLEISIPLNQLENRELSEAETRRCGYIFCKIIT